MCIYAHLPRDSLILQSVVIQVKGKCSLHLESIQSLWADESHSVEHYARAQGGIECYMEWWGWQELEEFREGGDTS